jgi:hypothetical protein
LHQFLNPFIVELCRLRCKATGNGFFDIVVVEPPASKQGFQMQEHFGAKESGVKILSFGPHILSLVPPKMGKSPWSKNFEFGAKDPGVKIWSLGQKTPD